MRLRVLFCCIVVAIGSACSDPPDKERHQAEGAIEAARAAGAEVYAPAELQDAQAALKKYDDAVAQRDYRQALNDALEARDRAYDAAKQSGNKKAEERGQADRLIAELDTLVANSTTRLTTTSGRPVGPIAERLRASREAAVHALQEARSLVGKQDYHGAIAQVTPAIDRLRKDLAVAEPAAPRRRK